MGKDTKRDEKELRRLREDEETNMTIEAYDKFLSDMKTQINGEKREIAKNLLKNFPSLSVQDVAKNTNLPIEQVIKLEREVRQ